MSLKCDMFFFGLCTILPNPKRMGTRDVDMSPPCLRPRLRSDELPAPLPGGDKQYGRFRDTIFLNYWAIVFVQDVVFYVLFLHSVVFTSFVVFCFCQNGSSVFFFPLQDISIFLGFTEGSERFFQSAENHVFVGIIYEYKYI